MGGQPARPSGGLASRIGTATTGCAHQSLSASASWWPGLDEWSSPETRRLPVLLASQTAGCRWNIPPYAPNKLPHRYARGLGYQPTVLVDRTARGTRHRTSWISAPRRQTAPAPPLATENSGPVGNRHRRALSTAIHGGLQWPLLTTPPHCRRVAAKLGYPHLGEPVNIVAGPLLAVPKPRRGPRLGDRRSVSRGVSRPRPRGARWLFDHLWSMACWRSEVAVATIGTGATGTNIRPGCGAPAPVSGRRRSSGKR